MRSRYILVLFFAFNLVSLLSSAQRSFECQRTWSEPSADNSVSDCLTNGDRIRNQAKYYVLTAFCVVVFLFLVFVLPFICCGCFCSCCRCCCRCCKQTHRKQSDYVKALILSLIVLVMAVGVAIILCTGGPLLRKNTLDAVDAVVDDPLSYFNTTRQRVEELLVDYSTDPPTEHSIDLDEFDSVQTRVADKVHDIKDDAKPFLTGLAIATSVSGALVLIVAIIAVLVAFFELSWCACACGWAMYLFAVLLALLAIVCGVSEYFFHAACGEVVLQYTRRPGLFQWYVLPNLEEEFDFDGILDDVNSELLDASTSLCSELLNYCESESGTTATKPFVCGNDLTSASQCTSIEEVDKVFTGTYMKSAYTSTLCPAPSGVSSSDWTCTVEQCATYCSTTTLQESALTALNGYHYAVNASTAASYVSPMVQSNYILDVVLTVLDAEKTSSHASYKHKAVDRCSDARTSVSLLLAGYLIGTFVVLFALLVLLCIRPMEDEDLAALPYSRREKEENVNPVAAASASFDDDSFDDSPHMQGGPAAPSQPVPAGAPGAQPNQAVVEWY